MYARIVRMSSSVRVARTRMCLTMVAIILGGNLGGAAWHRPQFEWNLCSPEMRVSAGLSLVSFVLDAAVPVVPSFAQFVRANAKLLNKRQPVRIAENKRDRCLIAHSPLASTA